MARSNKGNKRKTEVFLRSEYRLSPILCPSVWFSVYVSRVFIFTSAFTIVFVIIFTFNLSLANMAKYIVFALFTHILVWISQYLLIHTYNFDLPSRRNSNYDLAQPRALVIPYYSDVVMGAMASCLCIWPICGWGWNWIYPRLLLLTLWNRIRRHSVLWW